IKALGLPCVVVQEGGYYIATLDEKASSFFAGMTA
ncbi:histone deacetylase family protein, partial [Pseudomonas syringae]